MAALPRMLVDPRRPMWDLGKPAIARKPFDYDGKRYETGDVFPWREVGCSERLLQTLWQMRHFDFGAIPPEIMPGKPAAAPAAAAPSSSKHSPKHASASR